MGNKFLFLKKPHNEKAPFNLDDLAKLYSLLGKDHCMMASLQFYKFAFSCFTTYLLVISNLIYLETSHTVTLPKQRVFSTSLFQ